ncbi:putative ACP1-mitochondrial acyl-carrier protein [Basidiobolus meristosporus CBS 931.73]|uniref:Acyl carrier protein n=1 Tax=Basidiobolus meristosporus CBS 931.73 TaxID=1314790 RepID=A0A1Y1Y5Y2_9FUNG|nr:putative ACP1-mitochondrial acyl-carrier protein [Basidiobolus meristosporus CBS 931.73]|eukprot:ORX93440.1 putative ACP1-mitochondrial acyl-carrier protein [Basidiobolus meristosporus CBS 931.73]
MLRFTALRPIARSIVASSVTRTAYPSVYGFSRFYSAGALSRSDIESRILDVLRGYDKVDQSKLNAQSHFNKDLGLDSLDTVEVVMAIEEEFSVEIPDKDADEIKTVGHAIDYITKREDAH